METLNSLCQTMSNVVDLRMVEYKKPVLNGNIEDVIFSILNGASRVKNGNLIDVSDVKRAISWAVNNGVAINISLLWAIGAHARSSFKILDWQYNVPRLEDIWALHWFHYLDQKIKTVYQPGICVVLIDEVPLSRLMGWNDVEMSIRKSILRKLVPNDLKVTIIDMPDLLKSELKTSISSGEILMVLTSSEIISTDLQIAISEELYYTHDKPWEEIKNKVGLNKWKEAEEIATQMSQISLARKETNWVCDSVFDNVPYIDGCILKKGRWSPDIWDSAVPQHGGSLLNYDGGKKFSIKIVPEFRLVQEVRAPCRVFLSEFQQLVDDLLPWNGEVMLYWT